MKRSATILLVTVLLTSVVGISHAQEPDNGTVSRGVGVVEAYQELLKENLKLRADLSKITDGADAEKKRSDELSRTVTALEQQIVVLVGQIDALKADQANRTDPAEVKTLKTRINGVEQEKARLTAQIGDLKGQIADLRKPTPEPPSAGLSSGPGVAPGSALHRQLEQEIVELRRQLQQLKSEKASVEAAGQTLRDQMVIKDAAISELEQSSGAASAERDALLKLGKHLRRLQGEVKDLEDDVQTKESKLRREEARIRLLEDQLADRDETIHKIKRVGELFDRIDEEQQVQRLPAIQKREHYRRQGDEQFEAGAYRLAQASYHKALSFDPSYADVHYNLGVLYDDFLERNGKAVEHYRRYLELRPHAGDSDLVRLWLREADLGM